MNPAQVESTALVALLRLGRRSASFYADAIEAAGSAVTVLERELADDDGQTSLLPSPLASVLEPATRDVRRWQDDGIRLLTLLHDDYPENLRAVHDRPPLIFVKGTRGPKDHNAIAIIGSRRASEEGTEQAARIAEHLVDAGYVVTSGLAAGIDTAAHTAVLARGGRTLAVLGTGLEHSYPPQNADLQRRVATEGALISQFWPDQPPTRQTFPRRNAVMSGLTLGTVIVEASATSGARIQARQALTHGRPVFLLRSLLAQPWAGDLAARPGTYVVDSPAQITAAVQRCDAAGALVG